MRFRACPAHIDETPRPGEAPGDFVQRMALEKARAAASALDATALVLGADTAVVLGDHILGKPADEAAAMDMLGRLSGRTHEVLTGVAGLRGGQTEVVLSRTAVTFRTIDATEARAYVATGEPMDKAGAYGIQGRAAVFVAHLEGSYSGVVGLPLYETGQILKQLERVTEGAAVTD